MQPSCIHLPFGIPVPTLCPQQYPQLH
uniref:3-ketoacyl-CoA thiolase 2 n=1 Tax=Rhizophora mucronata TaxID=61149 RepID=A0A2P2JQA4_RHIMU